MEKRTLNDDDDDAAPHIDDEPQKRIRSWPHVDGNYASFVSLPITVAGPVAVSLIDRAVEVCLEQGNNSSRSWERIPGDQLHVSVTRTFPVTRPNLVRFTRLICKAIQDEEMRAFSVVFRAKPVCLVNDAGTMSFLALAVNESCSGYQELASLSAALDEVLEKCSLPVYYDPPQFHVSLARAVGNHADHVAPLLKEANELCVTIRFARIDLLVGENLHSFELC